MRIKKSFRYNGKTGEGVHSEFFKTLIKSKGWHADLYSCVPKPYNNAELALLSKFIFGVELSVRFEYCYDEYAKAIKEAEFKKDIKMARSLKLYMLNPDKLDYILKSDVSFYCRTRDEKMVLVYLRYWCNELHSSYYDSKFNQEVFRSSYEVDSSFWKHCIGELHCGGIGGYSYGQVDITSIEEHDRVMNLFKSKDEPVRKTFRTALNKLIRKDKEYDQKSVEV